MSLTRGWALLALSASACIGPFAPDSVSAVSVSPPSLDLQVGAQQQLAVAVSASGGAPKSVAWTSSNPTAVGVDAVSGLVTAKQATTGVQICATSSFDSSRQDCASVSVYRNVTVRHWLRIPVTLAFPQATKRLSYGESHSFKEYGQSFVSTLDDLKYSDGSVIPTDLSHPFCLTILGVCDITANLITSYYSADITNNTAVTLYVQVRRPTAGVNPQYTCIASFSAGVKGSLPYFEHFFGNPYAGEFRIFKGSGCTGNFYDLPLAIPNYSTNPSGFIAVSLTTIP